MGLVNNTKFVRMYVRGWLKEMFRIDADVWERRRERDECVREDRWLYTLFQRCAGIRRLVFSFQTDIITNLSPACGGFSLFTAPFLLLCFDLLPTPLPQLNLFLIAFFFFGGGGGGCTLFIHLFMRVLVLFLCLLRPFCNSTERVCYVACL